MCAVSTTYSVLSAGSSPGQQAHDVVGFCRALIDRDRGPEPARQVEAGQWRTAVRQGLNRRVALARAGEDPLAECRTDHHSHSKAGLMPRVGLETHLRMQAGQHVAVPRDIGVRRCDRQDADGPAFLQRVRARGPRRGERGSRESGRRGSRQDHRYLASQIEPLEVVMALLRCADAIADEDEGRVHRSRARAPDIDRRIGAQPKRRALAAPYQSHAGACFHDAPDLELDRLEPSVASTRPETRRARTWRLCTPPPSGARGFRSPDLASSRRQGRSRGPTTRRLARRHGLRWHRPGRGRSKGLA